MDNKTKDKTSVVSHYSFFTHNLHLCPFFFFFFFFCVPLLPSNLCFAAPPGIIPLGATLTRSGELWRSPSGTFALSFYPSKYNTASGKYEVGVIAVSSNTLVWSVKKVEVSAMAKLELTQDGDLVLSEGPTVWWKSQTEGEGIMHGSVLENGDFQLVGSDGRPVWKSFDTPTDTLLPGQKLRTGSSLQTQGLNYSATFDGNLTLRWGSLPYWSNGASSSSAQLVREYLALNSNDGLLGIYSGNGSVLRKWHAKDYTKGASVLRRVTLDSDGNLRIYSLSAAGSGWLPVWQAVEDQCTVYGLCGSYGICHYNGSGDRSCVCPAGFVATDSNGDCRRIENLTGGCSRTMLTLDHTFLFFNTADLNMTTSNAFIRAEEDTCGSLCLSASECFASVALNDGSGSCYRITQDFASGYQSGAILATSFVKSCTRPLNAGSPSSSPTFKSARSPAISATIFSVSIVGAILATLAATACAQSLIWLKFFRGRYLGVRYGKLLDYASGAPLQFSYKELETATNRFQDRLGCGGFGAVYKGTLANRAKEVVAVKRLEGAAIIQGEKQFLAEVATMGSTHHTNLVRLCGFCSEGQHCLLVYEFHSNGSLDRHLFQDGKEGPSAGDVAIAGSGITLLTWDIRYNVVIGTARAITYLHQECRDCIIHCDIKPENILLDDNFGAKVSDFGLARMLKLAVRQRGNGGTRMTNVRGTPGYMAPEWRSNLPIDTKCDVYSFGVVVLEIVAGRRSFDLVEGRKFSEWAYEEYFVKERKTSVVDPRMHSSPQHSGNNAIDWEEVDRCMRVAYWCMQTQPSGRPPMNRVLQMLEGTIICQVPPMLSGSTSTSTTTTTSIWHKISQATFQSDIAVESDIRFVSAQDDFVS